MAVVDRVPLTGDYIKAGIVTVSLPHVLLGLLRSPATGYDLRRTFETGAAHYWAAELSQIYPALKKLEADGLVRSEDAPSTRGPRRRLYHRTPAGREALIAWVSSGPVVGTQRLAYVAQIEFAHEVGDLRVTADLVADLRAEFQPLHDLLESAAQELSDDVDDADFHSLLAIRLGVRTLAARLAWCDEAEALLDSRGA